MQEQFNNAKVYVHFAIGNTVWYMKNNRLATSKVVKIVITDASQIVHLEDGSYGNTLGMARSRKALLQQLVKWSK